jgi:DNA-binding GntR family transcriptional regulator
VPVDHDSPEPLYSQLADELEERIIMGEWATGPLPSIRTLQQTYDVGRDTVIRALRILADKGLVETFDKRGTWVKHRPV